MDELTRIINLQITMIGEEGKRKFNRKEQCADTIAKIVKSHFGADDVTVAGVQDFIWENKKHKMAAALTNADRIRNMSIDDLAAVIMCPYDTAGEDKDIMPCAQEGEDPEFTKKCFECCKEWLRKEVDHGET